MGRTFMNMGRTQKDPSKLLCGPRKLELDIQSLSSHYSTLAATFPALTRALCLDPGQLSISVDANSNSRDNNKAVKRTYEGPSNLLCGLRILELREPNASGNESYSVCEETTIRLPPIVPRAATDSAIDSIREGVTCAPFYHNTKNCRGLK